MLYYLFDALNEAGFPGAGVFRFLSFRAGVALLISILISAVFGKRLIALLRKKQVGESARDSGLDGQLSKAGTPTMGGLIILAAIVIPTVLMAKLNNIYVILMLVSTLWLGLIGFIDDYIKVFKKDKRGLAGRFKVIGQIGLGLLVGTVLYTHPSVVVRLFNGKGGFFDSHRLLTTLPFIKGHELDYGTLMSWLHQGWDAYAWVLFIPLVIFIITAVSNGANMTDGLDGLATGISAIIGLVLGIFAYVSGNLKFADYLNIMYIPNSGELVVFSAAFVGACVGFLWYNSFPAQVFMGDTGSLSLGGIIAVLAISLRKELMIPILCGVFLVENLSVILQVSYFKYTKSRFGEGRRIFKMAPLHHHYQKLGWHEAKIVARFWIVGLALAALTIITLKLR
jgi:phospho-N-acetylmuramoyl-pentapeptide-transferase